MSVSQDLFHKGRDAQDKLDFYFVGLTSAVFAYLAEHYIPKRLAWSLDSIDAVSLAFLAASLVFGFKRIESGSTASFSNFQILRFTDKADELKRELLKPGGPELRDDATGRLLSYDETATEREHLITQANRAREAFVKINARSLLYYRARNWLFLAGLLAAALAKMLVPYATAPVVDPFSGHLH